mgnify:CR=1 FL=1
MHKLFTYLCSALLLVTATSCEKKTEKLLLGGSGWNKIVIIDKDTKHMKQKLAVDFADLVYNGKWFTPLREALSAFVTATQKHVTGTVKLKLYKGNIITAGVTSPETLYSENLVTFEESDYNQNDATGFINLWGLPDTVQALREQGKL